VAKLKNLIMGPSAVGNEVNISLNRLTYMVVLGGFNDREKKSKLDA
jgi:hypothetical protein